MSDDDRRERLQAALDLQLSYLDFVEQLLTSLRMNHNAMQQLVDPTRKDEDDDAS